MARFVAGVALGLALGLVVTVRADDTDEVMAAATEAGVQPEDLTAALASLDAAGISTTPRGYLESVGELTPPSPPAPTRPHPPAGAVAQAGGGLSTASGFGPTSRVGCIESKESQGRNVANRQGSGAVGVLQYMPSTFAAHAREMGHPEYSPWVPWQARAVAAHDLALGRRGQWTVSGC